MAPLYGSVPAHPSPSPHWGLPRLYGLLRGKERHFLASQRLLSRITSAGARIPTFQNRLTAPLGCDGFPELSGL
jgi:hypothetical protein